VSAKQPGEEQHEHVLFNPPDRWLPFLSDGGQKLHLNADDTIARMLASFQSAGKATADTGVDAGLVAEDGTMLLVEAKRYVRSNKPRTKIQIVGILMGFSMVGVSGISAFLAIRYSAILVTTSAAAAIMAFLAFRDVLRSSVTEVSFRSALAGLSVRTLASIAALLSGRRRFAIREEWTAHLAGESGHDQVSWMKVKDAFGFLISAVHFRYSDAAGVAWTPAETILKSRTLSNLSVLIPTATAGYLVLRHEGTLGVVTSAESIAAIASALYGLIRVGRWWRDVRPPEPKARRAKE
jgi:hypothetical protein